MSKIVPITHYELERLLQRVAGGLTTERDAEILRKLLAHYLAISCEA